MTTSSRTWIPWAIVGVVLAVCTFLWMSKPAPVMPPLPNPNGYQYFVRAADITNSNRTSLTEEPTYLESQVRANESAFQLLRQGLKMNSAVPLEFSTNYLTTHLPELAKFKATALALMEAGRLAETQQRTNDAAHIFFEVIQFSDQMCRGGLIIDHLVGIAIHAIGVSNLRRIISGVPLKRCRDLIHELDEIDRKMEPASNIIERDRYWGLRTLRFGIFSRFAQVIMRLRHSKASSPSKSFETKQKGQKKRNRELMVRLAIQAFTLETGQPPTSITDLVPAYLKKVPIDPNTGGPLELDLLEERN